MIIQTEIRESARGFHVYASAPFGFYKRDFATRAEAESNRETVAAEFRAMIGA